MKWKCKKNININYKSRGGPKVELILYREKVWGGGGQCFTSIYVITFFVT